MTVPSGVSIGLRQHIQAEFGGPTTNVRLSAYYAGAGLVPAGTVGYPTAIPGAIGPHAPVAIPSSGTIRMSNFFGSTAVPPSFSFSLNPIYSNYNDADNLHFGGEISRSIGVFQSRVSNYSRNFTIPSNFTAPKIFISGWSVWCRTGYTWEEGWYRWRYRTTYYYDYMQLQGVGIYNTSGTLLGLVRNTGPAIVWNGSWQQVDISPGQISGLTPGNYVARYICEFRRDSDINYGDDSFGWSNINSPVITVSPQ